MNTYEYPLSIEWYQVLSSAEIDEMLSRFFKYQQHFRSEGRQLKKQIGYVIKNKCLADVANLVVMEELYI